jgi:streptomycin 6-kinase
MDHEVARQTKDRILNTPATIEKLGGDLHHATLRRMVQRGEIDPPMLIGGQNCWYESQADACLERKQAEAQVRLAKKLAKAKAAARQAQLISQAQ